MEAEALATLRESLQLNTELKKRFDRLGEFADRVEHLRTAKLVNNGQIIALKEQLAHFESRPESLPVRVPRIVPVPRMVHAAPTNEWHHLAQILDDTHNSQKVAVVGRSRAEVLAQLESRLGKAKAAVLAKRLRVYKKLSKGPHSKMLQQTPFFSWGGAYSGQVDRPHLHRNDTTSRMSGALHALQHTGLSPSLAKRAILADPHLHLPMSLSKGRGNDSPQPASTPSNQLELAGRGLAALSGASPRLIAPLLASREGF
ncbi:hypothetical protein KFL_007080020 [Klebsormidium nitens]|uniref:Uncharacterized protein n=1 Tax=Klebsormidium nitens TaxID=105231 RepID=A0A1Y1IJR7_KLENI|nr:hypothetical protein KFL_007080020 [Klebsormidium nitens]|eukprot:GAQ90963.1 hypothetical protein KFL_007080020 [Klebsormidium nitens]